MGTAGRGGGVDVAGTAGYGEDAQALARQYEGVAFEAVHREVLAWLPAVPSRVADIGAGTGRDAAALAARGHRVVAVEPTPELREIGRRLHPDTAVTWVDDALPALPTLSGDFDLVLLTAVWMHLDAPERTAAMRRLPELLRPAGQVVMSLRHGPVPVGRRMFDVSADETAALAARCGLRTVHRAERSDLHGRAEVHWSTLVLRKVP
ncbi:class I SAM-dependent methyltransferase [Streptomyces sp. NPDC092296]|uniref:class I SAM-dependent methyltransferase n=1 Tax=Streptomyces sp. NPDC092296 TaxID=3366012 RepID=UPI003819B8A7